MSGNDFPITTSITLHHPTVEEILALDNGTCPDQTYWRYVQIILADPYANMVMLDDMGKNYLEASPYEVFSLQWDNYMKNYTENKELYDTYSFHPLNDISNALQFFIKEKHCFLKGVYKDGAAGFYDKNDITCQINQEVFQYIYEWVKEINKIDYSEQIKPADENARLVLIDDMRNKIKRARRKKKTDEDDSYNYLGNIMSAVSFCGNGFLTPFNLSHCKIYWLNEALTVSNKKSNANHILDGLYHGTIRSKDINKKELDWIK